MKPEPIGLSPYTFGVEPSMELNLAPHAFSIRRPRTIGGIGNNAGELEIRTDGERYYWRITDSVDDSEWEEIPRGLFDTLIDFEKTRSVSLEKTSD